jgi:biopolymer transport protein ExbD
MKITKQKRRMHTIPLASLADVAFLLLIFMILTGTVEQSRRQDITLPVSAQSRPIGYEREAEICITVQGNVFFRGAETDLSGLKQDTLEEFSRFPGTVFFIKADADTFYEQIDPVVCVLKQNHIQNVVFMAEINSPRVRPLISKKPF